MSFAVEASSLPMLAVKESQGRRVMVELVDRTTVSGKLVLLDMTNGNVTLEDVLHRDRAKRPTAIGRMAIRGSEVRLIVLPKIVRSAPFLQDVSETIRRQLRNARRAALDARKAAAGKAKKDIAAIKARKLLKPSK